MEEAVPVLDGRIVEEEFVKLAPMDLVNGRAVAVADADTDALNERIPVGGEPVPVGSTEAVAVEFKDRAPDLVNGRRPDDTPVLRIALGMAPVEKTPVLKAAPLPVVEFTKLASLNLVNGIRPLEAVAPLPVAFAPPLTTLVEWAVPTGTTVTVLFMNNAPVFVMGNFPLADAA